MAILTTSLSEKLGALRQCDYFASLDEAVLGELAQGMELYLYPRRTILFFQDDPCRGLYMLRKGVVKLFKVSPQGRELIINIFRGSATFNEVPVFDDGLNPVNAAALEESEIWVLDKEVIRRALDAHPEMCRPVVLILSQNLRRLVTIVEEMSFYQITQRLARLLQQLAAERQENPSVTYPTQDQLAASLGTVREVLARSLRELERCGAIHVARRRISIVDAAILEQWGAGANNN